MNERLASNLPALAAAAALLGALLGLGASVREGDARRALILGALAAALVMTWLMQVAVRNLPKAPLGGTGYQPPSGFGPRLLHALATIAYTTGIMVFVLAVLMRWFLIRPIVPEGPVQWLPGLLGGYTLLLLLAAVPRIRQGRAPETVWTSRVHGYILAALAGGGLLLGLLLVGGPRTLAGVFLGDSDLLLVTLVIHLGIGTQIMVSYGLPTLFDVVTRLFRPAGTDAEPTPPILYAGVLASVIGVIAWYIAVRFDVWGRVVPSLAAQNAIALAVAIPLAALAFFAYAVVGAWLARRRDIAWRNRTAGTPWAVIVGLLGLIGAVSGVFATAFVLGNPAPDAWPDGLTASKDLFTLSVLLLVMPAGIWFGSRHRRALAIEERMPDLLYDVAEGRRAGLPLSRAVVSAKKNDYGPLNDDVVKLSHQVAWGVPVIDALERFARRTATPLVERAVVLVQEAVRTGGPLTDVLRSAGHQAHQETEARRERRASLGTYLIVIYVTFFVFLMVIAVLDVQFLPRLVEAKALGAVGLGSTEPVSLDLLRFTFFGAVLVQAIGNGLVGGILVQRRLTAGLIHVGIMTLATWLVFRLGLSLV